MPRESSASTFGLAFLDLLAPARCPGCDVVVLGGAAFCGPCSLLLEPAAAGAGAAFRYGGPLRDGVHRLKYEARRDCAPALAALLVEHALAEVPPVDCVVPLPLHATRLAERGYNQAALLARPVARALGVPLRPHRLERRRATSPQVGLDPAARERNVRGAFFGHPDAARPRVLLVDDVRTTGATLGAAEAALRASGATEVVTLALAVSGIERDAAL